jgi:hypothetical protein
MCRLRYPEDYITRGFILCIPHHILSGYQTKKIEMVRACSTYEGEVRYMQGFGGKPGRKRQLERRRRKWENNIKVYIREVGWVHGLDRSGSG